MLISTIVCCINSFASETLVGLVSQPATRAGYFMSSITGQSFCFGSCQDDRIADPMISILKQAGCNDGFSESSNVNDCTIQVIIKPNSNIIKKVINARVTGSSISECGNIGTQQSESLIKNMLGGADASTTNIQQIINNTDGAAKKINKALDVSVAYRYGLMYGYNHNSTEYKELVNMAKKDSAPLSKINQGYEMGANLNKKMGFKTWEEYRACDIIISNNTACDVFGNCNKN